MNHARHRLRAVLLDERLQVDAVEVLHRVVEHALRRPAEIVDRHRVGMVELAGDLHLAFEPLDRSLVHLVDVEHLDRRRPAQHRVLSLVDDAHAAGAELVLKLVLADLLGFDRRLLRLAPQPRDHHREHENRQRREG